MTRHMELIILKLLWCTWHEAVSRLAIKVYLFIFTLIDL